MEAKSERALRDVVKNARSMFYMNKGKQNKLSRKNIRHNKRLEKKSKQNEYRLKKFNKETSAKEIPVEKKKKKKRKRKRQQNEETDVVRTIASLEDDGKSYEREAYEAANKQEEKLISTLGKKLRVSKKTNLPSVFKDDGLDYLLDVCEPLTQDNDGNSSDEEYLAMKSMAKKKLKCSEKKTTVTEGISEKLLFEVGAESEDERILAQGDVGDSDEESADEAEGQEMFNYGSDNENDDSKNDDNEKADNDNVNETTESKQKGKYIPPALRKLQASSVDETKVKEQQVKKQLKGLLNRVSEASLPGITAEIEHLYSRNSRNTMNETLYNLISESCVTSARMPERLIMEHIVIVAALHKLTGSEVGSYFLQMLAERFSSLHQDGPVYGEGKECQNLLFMLTCLYNLKVVDSLLIYDLIQRFLNNFYEQDIEMILLILKACGSDIRKDDPGALKDVILEVQAKSITTELKDNSRVRFMLDIINALKNNNMRKIPQYDPTLVEEAKKSLKLITKGKDNMNSGSQLKISLEDLLNAKDKGKWWVVGSSWTGRGPIEEQRGNKNENSEIHVDVNSKLLEAAKRQRMNTNLRKNIFCVMMTSEDYADAFERLIKLNLKEKQAREIIHVILDCCLQEKSYNPFYAHLTETFCEYSRSNQVTLQYSIWDRFKLLSTLSKYSTVNLAHFLAHAVAAKSLSLAVLKVVSFGALEKPSIKFFISFFKILLLQYPTNIFKFAFQRISLDQKLTLLREGIKVFLRHFIYPNSEEKEINIQTKKIKELIEMAESALDGTEYVPL